MQCLISCTVICYMAVSLQSYAVMWHVLLIYKVMLIMHELQIVIPPKAHILEEAPCTPDNATKPLGALRPALR